MKNKFISNDIPILEKEQDLLNYYPYSEKIKQIIQGYSSNSEPLTIGIYGKWGMGKTSLLNLIEKNIEVFEKDKNDKRYIKFHYNPWLYQSKEEMLFDFFDTLSKKLFLKEKNENLKKAGKLIRKYGRYLKALKISASVGIPKIKQLKISFEPHEIAKALGEDLIGEETSLSDIKNSIDEALELSDKKIIIFIDDIDRLDKDEIFTLLKLVKLNANFKNLIFILCLDKEHVAKAIYLRYGSDESDGEEFLEKIINIPLELPLIENSRLDFFLKEKLHSILSNQNIFLTDEEKKELIDSINGKYFNSPREIVRSLNSFSTALFALKNEVNIHDLFWIEFLKIKHYKAYIKIKDFVKNIGSYILFEERVTLNDYVTIGQRQVGEENGLREDIKNNYPEAYDIVCFLFPIIRQNSLSAFGERSYTDNELDKKLKVSHKSHIEKYFTYNTKGKISEVKYKSLIKHIETNSFEYTIEILTKILENGHEHTVVYRLLDRVVEEKDKEIYEKYIRFLIENINQFSVTKNQDYPIEIIRKIAEKLRTSNLSKNKGICFETVEKLSLKQYAFFIGMFRHDNNIEYLNDLLKKYIDKVKSHGKSPFYKDRYLTIMTMEIWNEINAYEFVKYIYDSLELKENIAHFITSFPSLRNGTINGAFKLDNFNFIKDSLNLNIDKIYDSILIHLPEFKNLNFNEERVKWGEHNGNTPETNIKQFLYYKKDFDEKKLLLLKDK